MIENEPGLLSLTRGCAPQGKEVDYWNQVLHQYRLPITFRPYNDHPVQIDFLMQQFGQLRLANIQSSPHIAEHGLSRGRDVHDTLVFVFTRSGTIDWEQDGKSLRLRRGASAFFTGVDARTMSFLECSHLHFLEIPRARVTDRVSGFAHLANRELRASSELLPIVEAYVRQLALRTTSLNAYSAARISDNLSDLLCAMLAEEVQKSPLPLSECKTAALMRVRMFVETHLADPDLKPATVAQALRLSTRYINHLLQAEGTSLERLIRHRRLERIAADLRDPALSGRSIAIIALSRGFNDPSHFSTAFRRRYGVSPREHRMENS